MKIAGQFSKVSFDKYDLNSPGQLKEFLFSLGWKPDTWNYNKVTKEKTSPKITISSLESIGQSQLGKWVGWYYTLRHRRNMLENRDDPEGKGLLSFVDERGRVAADAFTIGTPTSRYRHQAPVLNIPKCNQGVIYGCQMREVYCVLEPYRLVGSDLSGVEARMLGHFTSFFDGGSLAKEILEGDIHTKTAEVMGVDRNTAKTIRYAISYGAGVGKVASILSCSNKEAEKAIDLFYAASPSLKILVDYLKAFYKKHKYLKAIDGRRLFIRSEHVLLNSLIQASSAVLFKSWGCKIWDAIDRENLDSEIIISFHDEYQCRVHKDIVDRFSVVLKDTLRDTQEQFKLRVDLATDTKVGMNWRQTH